MLKYKGYSLKMKIDILLNDVSIVDNYKKYKKIGKMANTYSWEI